MEMDKIHSFPEDLSAPLDLSKIEAFTYYKDDYVAFQDDMLEQGTQTSYIQANDKPIDFRTHNCGLNTHVLGSHEPTFVGDVINSNELNTH